MLENSFIFVGRSLYEQYKLLNADNEYNNPKSCGLFYRFIASILFI